MKTKTCTFLLLSVLLLYIPIRAQNRWNIQKNGSICWNIGQDIPHSDHLEMSGLQISAVLRYGVKADGSFSLERSIIWPMLRTIPNDTHASLMQRFSIDYPSQLIINGLAPTNEQVKSIRFDGRLTVISQFETGYMNIGSARKGKSNPVIQLTRTIFPSTDKPILCEHYSIKNISGRQISVNIPKERAEYKTETAKGVDGSYTMIAAIQNHTDEPAIIATDEEVAFYVTIQAYKKGQSEILADVEKEEEARQNFVQEVWSKLAFDSPDRALNTAFAFAKIRASESIYKTKGGYMHGPGGESYYAAVWANDQAEYVNPFFPYLGYEIGNKSAFNSFVHFASYINEDFNPIPSSIIAEGESSWGVAGDRGDGAMVAYGAARYALAKGDKEEAKKLWPLIQWCLEFNKRKLTKDGVVASDSDELERRFPAGDANLCTSSLYYDALISAAYLAESIGISGDIARQYRQEAQTLKANIEKHFGAKVEGYDTYRYYEGNDILRSWICIPLTVGIYDRKSGTIDALFSPRLWTNDGLLTQAGTETFWDRSTLYALRGVFAAGEREKAFKYMQEYSAKRLLGDHVPYPIEAWPEGSQRHLSAESGLYCRVITEGLFGIRPTGFNSFVMTPQLPDEWNYMNLDNVMAFSNHPFDIHIERKGDKIKTQIIRNNKIVKSFTSKVGETLTVKL